MPCLQAHAAAAHSCHHCGVTGTMLSLISTYSFPGKSPAMLKRNARLKCNSVHTSKDLFSIYYVLRGPCLRQQWVDSLSEPQCTHLLNQAWTKRQLRVPPPPSSKLGGNPKRALSFAGRIVLLSLREGVCKTKYSQVHTGYRRSA